MALMRNSDAEYNALPSGQDGGSQIRRSSAPERVKAFAASLADAKDDSPANEAFSIFLRYFARPFLIVCSLYVQLFKFLYGIYKMLPMNVVQMIFGAALCLFGGVFFTSIAAIEAFRNFGGQVLVDELTICWNDAEGAAKASAEDDEIDADGDGIADVLQISKKDLLQRKARVVMVAIKDPQRLAGAVQYLMSAYVSVLATLKFQFAKTVALSLAIAGMLELPTVRVLAPILARSLGPELNHWACPIISTTMKMIAVVVAAYVQATISAFYSALRGASLFGEALINIAAEQGLMDQLPENMVPDKPFNANNSWWDEIIGFPLAAFGFAGPQ
eukprot:gnl/MRDRNA2_/MRDRNA2_20666_c0_seq2.p1 gnl/MRDRNA2_/MRDRNA2_20666_c0~~gnl/MRDRNA2_/MRDRNA2_20666_c0_seq2.p1  ORF type:complete len:331 (+),score=69.82 gnl/MRDRNA2_/MRDRNA2_20666_c0_seq2:119-1111(+)